MYRPVERLGCPADQTATDYRTVQAESVRLPGETAIDKCVRLAKRLQLQEGSANLTLDLPNPNLPHVFDEVDIPTFLVYVRVAKMLAWLEVAAKRTYRKNRLRAVGRLYSNLEKESEVPQHIFRAIRCELKLEHLRYLDRIADCVLREPIYDPLKDPKPLRRLVRRKKGNVIQLHIVSYARHRPQHVRTSRQLTLPLS